MREILFRGKRVSNGEWVEGYYTELPVGSLAATIFSNDKEIVCEDTTSYIIKVFAKQHSNYPHSNPLQVIECEKYEVIPETVGQYTGLKDKNGVKIFEGDILEYDDGYDYFKAVIKYKTGSFGAVCCDSFVGFGEMEWYSNQNYDMAVIGNIYDNLELVEVKNG